MTERAPYQNGPQTADPFTAKERAEMVGEIILLRALLADIIEAHDGQWLRLDDTCIEKARAFLTHR